MGPRICRPMKRRGTAQKRRDLRGPHGAKQGRNEEVTFVSSEAPLESDPSQRERRGRTKRKQSISGHQPNEVLAKSVKARQGSSQVQKSRK